MTQCLNLVMMLQKLIRPTSGKLVLIVIPVNKPMKSYLVKNKNKSLIHLYFFNNTKVCQTSSQKNLGIILNSCLSFGDHFKMTQGKINKS